jgi:hypothetical protein
LLITAAAAVAAMAWSWSLGDHLGRPPWQPARWEQWWGAREPLDAVAAVASLLAVVALGWLVLVAVVHLGATLWGLGRLRRSTAGLLPPLLRMLVAAAALGTATTGTTPVGAAPQPAAVADAAPASPPDDVPPTMVRLDPPSTAGAAGVPRDAPPPAPGPSDIPGAASLRVRVEPGDHLWGIAASRLRLALGEEPDTEQVRPYWAALVEANRDRLVDPDDPDLLLPGQELVLPG